MDYTALDAAVSFIIYFLVFMCTSTQNLKRAWQTSNKPEFIFNFYIHHIEFYHFIIFSFPFCLFHRLAELTECVRSWLTAMPGPCTRPARGGRAKTALPSLRSSAAEAPLISVKVCSIARKCCCSCMTWPSNNLFTLHQYLTDTPSTARWMWPKLLTRKWREILKNLSQP